MEAAEAGMACPVWWPSDAREAAPKKWRPKVTQLVAAARQPGWGGGREGRRGGTGDQQGCWGCRGEVGVRNFLTALAGGIKTFCAKHFKLCAKHFKLRVQPFKGLLGAGRIPDGLWGFPTPQREGGITGGHRKNPVI